MASLRLEQNIQRLLIERKFIKIIRTPLTKYAQLYESRYNPFFNNNLKLVQFRKGSARCVFIERKKLTVPIQSPIQYCRCGSENNLVAGRGQHTQILITNEI